jgi:pimeloyl-ACP methyl ester carboxylesterase
MAISIYLYANNKLKPGNNTSVNPMNKALFSILFLLAIPCIPVKAKVFNDSIPAGKNFEKAAFRLWYPDNIKEIRTIVVLVPGSNGDGRGMVSDSAWQNFAYRNGLALLGCYFTDTKHPDQDIEYYVKTSEGSGQALLDVINRFAAGSVHPELANAPLLLWGHSAGGQFNYEFACWKPGRVMAFVVNKGGIYYTAIASAATRQVPGIFFTGEKDIEFRIDIINGIFAVNRRFGALWAIAKEPGAGHEPGLTQKLTIEYFQEILALRFLQTNAESRQDPGMRELREDSGFIGDPKTHKITPFNQWKKTSYPTAWLPTSWFSEKWRAFVEGKF